MAHLLHLFHLDDIKSVVFFPELGELMSACEFMRWLFTCETCLAIMLVNFAVRIIIFSLHHIFAITNMYIVGFCFVKNIDCANL